MYKICVYAICKNELQNLNSWLNWTTQADYVCILDTGSTDGTWEQLKQYTNKYSNLIIQQKIISPWRFDTARNESLKLVPSDTDIYFMADLDEIMLTQNWYSILQTCWKEQYSRGSFIYHRVTKNKIHLLTYQEYRIHSKKWNHWNGIVHEYLTQNEYLPLITDMRELCETSLEIEHNEISDEDKEQKRKYYIKLLEQSILEDPTDTRVLLQLLCSYSMEDIRANETIQDLCLKILALNEQKQQLYNYELSKVYSILGLYFCVRYKIHEGIKMFKRGIQIDGTFSDNYFYLSDTLFQNLATRSKALKTLEKGLTYGANNFWCTSFPIQSYSSLLLYASILISQNKYFKALGVLTYIKNQFNTSDCDNDIKQVLTFINKNGH